MTETADAKSSNDIDAKRVMDDFKTAYAYKQKWMDMAQDDFEFALGRQWDDADVDELKQKGVRALTINKVRPNIKLLAGMESQNRSEFKAYPEGKEDDVTAEVATRLLKNVMKTANGDYKVSEMFEDGVTCGECYLEPFLDFTYNLFGEMKLKKVDYYNVLPQPGFKEYDMSDADYVCKVTYDLNKDQLFMIFSEDSEQKKIEDIEDGKINLDNIGGVLDSQGARLQKVGYKDGTVDTYSKGEKALFDLVEYYYKKYTPAYFVAQRFVDPVTGARQASWRQTDTKEEAENFAKGANAVQPESATVIKRTIPEMWCCSVVGGEEIRHEQAWFWPKWKGYPFIPYFADRSTAPLRSESRELAVQGLVRSMKDLNREFNKRRTQELRILGTTASSGWLTPKGAWVDKNKVEKYGSMAGVNLEYHPDKGVPQRIEPPALSQAHAQMAAEHNEDMKSASGINADLLAMEDGGQASGRAIMLRQKQGMVMVQKLFDNLSQTKRLLGRFILSQLSELYDRDSAIRVVGEEFLQENFLVPVMAPVIDPRTGQPAAGPDGQPMMQPVVDPMTGQPQMQIDQQAVVQAFDKVLTDTQVGKFDVAIGENVNNETIQYGNYLMMVELAQQGAPIPPDVLVESSLLPSSAKKKIQEMMQQQAAQAANPKRPAPAGGR